MKTEGEEKKIDKILLSATSVTISRISVVKIEESIFVSQLYV